MATLDELEDVVSGDEEAADETASSGVKLPDEETVSLDWLEDDEAGVSDKELEDIGDSKLALDEETASLETLELTEDEDSKEVADDSDEELLDETVSELALEELTVSLEILKLAEDSEEEFTVSEDAVDSACPPPPPEIIDEELLEDEAEILPPLFSCAKASLTISIIVALSIVSLTTVICWTTFSFSSFLSLSSSSVLDEGLNTPNTSAFWSSFSFTGS